jgi:hypothetical protein
VLICFGPPVTFAVLKFFDVYDAPANLLIATMVLGCLYFPMAFLAVAMKDTALAANPLVVIPAIWVCTLLKWPQLVVVAAHGRSLPAHFDGTGTTVFE